MRSGETAVCIGFKRTVDEFRLLQTFGEENMNVMGEIALTFRNSGDFSEEKLGQIGTALFRLRPKTVDRNARRSVVSKTFIEKVFLQCLFAFLLRIKPG